MHENGILSIHYAMEVTNSLVEITKCSDVYKYHYVLNILQCTVAATYLLKPLPCMHITQNMWIHHIPISL